MARPEVGDADICLACGELCYFNGKFHEHPATGIPKCIPIPHMNMVVPGESFPFLEKAKKFWEDKTNGPSTSPHRLPAFSPTE